VRQQARRVLTESRKHHAVKLLRQIPSIGLIRAALLVAQLQTPNRCRTKRQPSSESGGTLRGRVMHKLATVSPFSYNAIFSQLPLKTDA
jgi:hypothetical protein